MAPCPYIGYGYNTMVLDMGLCEHIITLKDLDMAPYPHITAQSGYGSMYAYYCSHGYGYDSMSAYLSL